MRDNMSIPNIAGFLLLKRVKGRWNVTMAFSSWSIVAGNAHLQHYAIDWLDRLFLICSHSHICMFH
jgi:hypothetical protein